MTNKIYTAIVGNDADGEINKVDVIKYDGKIWLVPHWLEAPALQVSRPARIIRLDNQPYQHVPGSPFGDYVLSGPIPKVLLEPTTPKEPVDGWEYIELPDIDIPASVRPIDTGQKRGVH